MDEANSVIPRIEREMRWSRRVASIFSRAKRRERSEFLSARGGEVTDQIEGVAARFNYLREFFPNTSLANSYLFSLERLLKKDTKASLRYVKYIEEENVVTTEHGKGVVVHAIQHPLYASYQDVKTKPLRRLRSFSAPPYPSFFEECLEPPPLRLKSASPERPRLRWSDV